MQEILDQIVSFVGPYITYSLLIYWMLGIVKVLLLLLAARLAIFLGKKTIANLFDRMETGRFAMDEKLAQTVEVVVRTLFVYSIYFLVALLILESFKVPVLKAEDLKNIGGQVLKSVVIIIAARMAIRFGGIAIENIFNPEDSNGTFIEGRRTQTLTVLLRSVLMYSTYFIAGLMILDTFNVPTGSILASAGIVGLAVGFGAQNLVKDIITGFFIIFEDQFSVGEFVTIADVTGVVDEVGLRTSKVREWTGQLHTIPNGEIGKVTNFNRGKMMALVTVGIAYEEDIDKAIEVMRKASEKAQQELESLVEVPIVQGVVELADSAVVIRAIANTVPGEQWAMERELRKRYKQALDANDIEIPYPRRVIIPTKEQTVEGV